IKPIAKGKHQNFKRIKNLPLLIHYHWRPMVRQFQLYFIVSAVVLFIASCSSPKKVIYFKDNVANDDTVVTLQSLSPIPEIRIQPDDIISINVTSISSISEQNPDPVNIFNEGGTRYPLTPLAGSVSGSGVHTSGYLVDMNGEIDFPV